MEFYGYHGVYPEENKLGQRFIVDLILECDLREAGRTDQLDQTINYAEVYDVTQNIVEGKPFNLVESVAETLAQTLLSKFSLIDRCHIKVVKPDPPIRGHYESVAIGITRSRQDE